MHGRSVDERDDLRLPVVVQLPIKFDIAADLRASDVHALVDEDVPAEDLEELLAGNEAISSFGVETLECSCCAPVRWDLGGRLGEN